MKKNILQQIGTREEPYTVTVVDAPETTDEATGEATPAVTHEETRTRIVPVMQAVTVDMTPEEEAALAADAPAAEPEDTRLDDIEAALMELAEIIGGTSNG